LADRFREGPAPLWLDEGVALQYDAPAKLRLHERDLRLSLERGAAFSLPELLLLDRYPSADRWGAFYGQSASLVRTLLTKGTARQLLAFVEETPHGGMSMALRANFGLGHWRDIQSALPKADRQNSALQLISVTEFSDRASK
jgi:hypothetical protein